MNKRIITNVGDPLLKPDGSAWKDISISFTLVDVNQNPATFYDIDSKEYITGKVVVRTDNLGEFTVELYTNSNTDFTSQYFVVVATNPQDTFISTLKDGTTPITFYDFRHLYTPPRPEEILVIEDYLGSKVDKVEGKELSSNDFTDEDKTKLDNIGTTTVTSVNTRTGNVILIKEDVGLNNVDNTTDLNKPVSTSTQAALDLKASQIDLGNHTTNTNNPHVVTKTQVGLGNVVNIDTTTTANITDSLDKRFVTDLQVTTINNQSGTNTGDQDLSGLVPKTTTVNGKALSTNITLNADDVSDGITNAIVTLVQETNFETAYTHSQTTGNQHSTNHDQLNNKTGGDTVLKIYHHNPSDIQDITKDPTGFLSPELVIVTGDTTTRTVTLTGTTTAYFKGKLVSILTSGWVSPSHGIDTSGIYFLHYNGTDFIWDTSYPVFHSMHIVLAFYDTNNATWIYQRECHGLISWQAHRNEHFGIGTRKESGGSFSGYVLGSIIAADRRPDVSSVYIYDEDLLTINSSLTSKLYNKFYLSDANIINYTGETSDTVPLVTGVPFWNQYTGGAWQQSPMAVNSYMTIWVLAIPVANDTNSQKYRLLWIQGQANNTSLQTEQALTSNSLNLGNISATEYTFIGRVIIRYIGGNWSIQQIDAISGSRINQTSNPSGSFLASVETDLTLTGNGTLSSPLRINLNNSNTWSGDQTFSGNVFVQGDKIAVDTRITVADNILALNRHEVSNVVTSGYSGIEVDRGSGDPYTFSFFESDDSFRVGIYYVTITYIGKTGSFNLNNEIKGETSLATGYVISDSGTTLKLKIINGTFVDGEVINNQDTTGSATISGSPVVTNDTQAVATREDTPTDGYFAKWNNTLWRFDTTSLFGHVSGTGNQITITDDSDGTITIGTPQDIATNSNVQFGSMGLGMAISHNAKFETSKVAMDHAENATYLAALTLTGGGYGGAGSPATNAYALRLFESYGWNFTLQNNINSGFRIKNYLGNSYNDGNDIFVVKQTLKAGVNTSNPGKAFEINDVAGQCLRLTYNDSNGSATYYTDFAVSSAGALTVTPTAGAGINFALSTTGDFSVNSGALFVDTSTGFVGVNTIAPSSLFTVTSIDNLDSAALEISNKALSKSIVFGAYSARMSGATNYTFNLGTITTKGHIATEDNYSYSFQTNLGICPPVYTNTVKGIWSIGPTYKVTSTTSWGNLFGIGYAYNGSGKTEAPITNAGHQICFASGGTVNAAVGLSGAAYFKSNVSVGDPNGATMFTAKKAYSDLGGSNLQTDILEGKTTDGTSTWSMFKIAGLVGSPDNIVNYPGGMAIYTKPDGTTATPMVEAIRIDALQRVGIGRTPDWWLGQKLEVGGNIYATGWIRGAAAGQVLNVQMVGFNDTAVIINSTTYTTVASCYYTTVSGSSYIIVEFYTSYTIEGSVGDSYLSQLNVGSTQITYGYQRFIGASGGGTRSGVLFPLMGRYTNSEEGATLSIYAQVRRESADDNATFQRNIGTWMRITEIAR